MGKHGEFETPDMALERVRQELRAAYPKCAEAKDFMESLFGPVNVVLMEENGAVHRVKNYKADSRYLGCIGPTAYIEMGKKGAAVEVKVQTSAQRGGQRGNN